MPKRENSKGYERNRVEVQKGPISMDEQYSNNFRREPEHTMRDVEDNKMRQEKMTLTLHTPKK
jgi:hypothetical protein